MYARGKNLRRSEKVKSQTSLHEYAIKFLLIHQHKGRKCEPGLSNVYQPKFTALATKENNAIAGYEGLFVHCLTTEWKTLGSVSSK